MHAGEQIGIDDILRCRGGDHLLVTLRRIGLHRSNERGTDVGKVGP